MKKQLLKKIITLSMTTVLLASSVTTVFAAPKTIRVGTNSYNYKQHWAGGTIGLADCFAAGGYCSYSIWSGMNTTDSTRIKPSEIPETIEGYPVVCLREAYNSYSSTGASVIFAPEIPKYVEDMESTFSLSRIPAPPSRIPDKVSNLKYTFSNCKQMGSFPLLGTGLKNMTGSFSGCSSAKGTVKLPSGVEMLNNTFRDCTQLTEIPNISHLTNVKDVYCAFQNCVNATGGTDLPKGQLKSLDYMFNSCKKMTTPPREISESITSMRSTFKDCSMLSGEINVKASISSANPNNYSDAFTGSATTNGAELILNYTKENESAIDDIIAKKIITSNIKKGVLISNEDTTKPLPPVTVEITKFPKFSYSSESGLVFNVSDFVIIAKDENQKIAEIKNFDVKVDDTAFKDLSGGTHSAQTTITVILGDRQFKSTPTITVDVAEKVSNPDTGNDGSQTNPPQLGEADGELPSVPDYDNTNEVKIANGKGNQNVIVQGVVEPINTLDVDIPVKLQFIIDENRQIHYTKNAKVISRSPAPIDVYSSGVTVPKGAPLLVDNNAFENWDNLNVSQTKQNIAISINNKNLVVVGVKLGSIESGFTGAKTLPLNPSVLYGKQWVNTKQLVFDYVMNLELALAQ